MTRKIFIGFDHLKHGFWRYSHANGYVATETLSFRPDGRVAGYSHDNERFWRIDDGTLCFLDKDGIVTVRFDSVEIEDGLLLLKGNHIPAPAVVLRLDKHRARVRYGTTQTALAAEIAGRGWSVGDHTYGVPSFSDPHLARFVVGKYCSIADGVRIALGDHRVDTVTTYPFAALARFWQNVPAGVDDHSSKGDVVIGSDVWIGVDVFIGSGVRIGNGAVIGAKSVVVKDVPPYAVAVGNPARIVRHRFDPATVASLLDLAWWDLADDRVDALIPALLSNDVETFLASLRRERSTPTHGGGGPSAFPPS